MRNQFHRIKGYVIKMAKKERISETLAIIGLGGCLLCIIIGIVGTLLGF